MPRLKFEMFPDADGLTTVFTDGNGVSSETWWGSPPSSIDDVCIRYLADRFSNCKKPRHEAFIKRRYHEEFSKYTRMPDSTYELAATIKILSREDRQLLLRHGMTYSDLDQVERAISKTTFTVEDRQITFEEAIGILGREEMVLGLGRSSYHYTTSRESEDGTFVHFDSYALFD